MTPFDPLQLSDPPRLPPKEVCLLRPLTLQLPGPPQNKVRWVPSGAELAARTNTLSEEERRFKRHQMSACLEKSAWEKKKREKRLERSRRRKQAVDLMDDNKHSLSCGNVQNYSTKERCLAFRERLYHHHHHVIIILSSYPHQTAEAGCGQRSIEGALPVKVNRVDIFAM